VAGGTISGTVSDPSSAPIPGATVVLLSQATGVTRELTTNASGFYRAPNLLPGRYRVTVSLTGFATLVENIELNVGGEAVVNAQLRTGELKEMVEVEAKGAAVEHGTSTLGATVGGTTIRELPLNGRDWTMLATLEPGAHTVDTQNPSLLGNTGRINRGWGTQITVNGARPQQNNYRLDGVSINDWSGGGPGNTIGMNLGVEAIQEFSVVTGNASADYGKTSGGVFNAITRSGSNLWHGSTYEFHRNSKLDAKNFFDASEPPPFHRNQFGFSLGGPIRKDRTFIFGDYEGLRESLSTTNLINVPSTAARTGQLASGRVAVDPRVVPYLALFPQPNVSDQGDIGIAGLVQEVDTTENFFTVRADHTLGQRDNLHATVMSDGGRTVGPDTHDLELQANNSRRKLATLEHTHIFGANLVNTARVGYSRVVGEAPVTLDTINAAVRDIALGFIPGHPTGTINVSGLTRFPGVDAQLSRFFYNSYQGYDDVFVTRGRHALKLGVALEHIRLQESTDSSVNGGYDFGSLTNFLTDVPASFSATAPGTQTLPTYLRQTVLGAYVQDDWRLRPNLTFNLGLRYEMATVPTEKNGRLATLTSLPDREVKLGSPYFDNPTLLGFSPRVGFTWDPFRDGRTSVRGAFGIYDTLPLTYLFGTLTMVAGPYARVGVVTNPGAGSFPTGAIGLVTPEKDRVSYIEQDPSRSYVEQWNLNLQRELVRDLTLLIGYVGSHGVHQPFRTQDTDIVLPTETADGLFWPVPRNSGTRLNESFGQIQALAWNVSTVYHAMNVKLTKRMSHGVQAGASYTWGKSIDSNSATIAGGQFANSINGLPLFWPGLFRGLSDFDVRQSLTLNTLVEIPGPGSSEGGAGWLTHGWQIGGILRVASGHPFSVLVGGDSLGQKSNNPFNFPDRLDTPECRNPVNPGDPVHYIKTECFVVPQPNNRLGNAGRNTLEGPGLADLDMSLYKNTKVRRVSDTFNVQLRVEFFNVLNRPNFRPPTGANAQIFNASFNRNSTAGRLTATATTSRQIQLAVKLVW
jgi:outer membrane receptor protein involved in Fe transport